MTHRSSKQKLLLRTALALAQHYRRQVPVKAPELPSLEPSFASVQRLMALRADVLQRGWSVAAHVVEHRLTYALETLQSETTSLLTQLSPATRPRPLPTLRLLIDELQSLEGEFENVEFRLRDREIRVRTESIVLEDLTLGPFEICWCWETRSGSPRYRVVALEPFWAEGKVGISHPHVRDELLCEGEGRSVIAAALADGRIGEFFLLVQQVLKTYNDHSAFQSIYGWGGQLCESCGDRCPSDDGCGCDDCGDWICDSCSQICNACDTSFCSSCAKDCAVCDLLHCSDCLTPCRKCARQCCQRCQLDTTCATCRQPPSESADATSETPSSSSVPSAESGPAAEVQPVCLGEASVLS